MNLVNGLLTLIATIILCAFITLLLDWPWIAHHWIRQLLVSVLTISILLIGMWIAIKNLTQQEDT